MNSDLIREQVAYAAGRIDKVSPPNDTLVRELYLAAFSREPREVELAKLLAHLEANPNRRQAIDDLIWAVINTNEFLFQH